MSSQLQKDIDNHVSAKFETWMTDSIDTYRRAGLNYHDSLGHMVYCSLLCGATLMTAQGVSGAGMLEAFDHVISSALAEHLRHQIKEAEE